jgi:hypothetical protein
LRNFDPDLSLFSQNLVKGHGVDRCSKEGSHDPQVQGQSVCYSSKPFAAKPQYLLRREAAPSDIP